MGEEFQAKSMISFTGELPPEWASRWEEFKNKATRPFDLIHEDQTSVLQQNFDKHVNDEDLKRLVPVIRGLTRMLPSDRTSADEALRLLQRITS